MSELHTDTPTMPAGSANSAGPKARLLTLADLDGRTRAARYSKEVLETIIGERGGRDRMNVVQLKSAEAYAVLTAMIVGIGAGWHDGQVVDASEYSTLLNARRREAQLMGGPEPRDITPSLAQYLTSKAAKPVASASNVNQPEQETMP